MNDEEQDEKFNYNPLHFIRKQLQRIERNQEKMAIDQKTFDTDLAALVTSIGNLVTAVDALIAKGAASADLTTEDTSVQAAAASVTAELNKLNPPAPVTPPASIPTA